MKYSTNSNESNPCNNNTNSLERLKSFSKNILESTVNSLKSGVKSTREKLIGNIETIDKSNVFNPTFLSSASLLILTGFLNSAPALADQPKYVIDQFDKIKSEYRISEICDQGSSIGMTIKSFREHTDSSGNTIMENLRMAKVCKQELLIKSFYLGDIDSNGNFKEGGLNRYIASELNDHEPKLNELEIAQLVSHFKNNKSKVNETSDRELSDYEVIFSSMLVENGQNEPTENDIIIAKFCEKAMKVERDL